MPPKRKSTELNAENDQVTKSRRVASKSSDQSESVLKMMFNSESKPKEDESNTETIKYDEYFEAGIPDALLEGLGFSESDKPEKDSDSDVELNTVATPDIRSLNPSDSLMTFPYGLIPGGLVPVPIYFPSATALAVMASLNNCATLGQAMQLPALQAGLAAGLLQNQRALATEAAVAAAVQSNALASPRTDTTTEAAAVKPTSTNDSNSVKPSVVHSTKRVQAKSAAVSMKSTSSTNGHVIQQSVSQHEAVTNRMLPGPSQSASQKAQSTFKTQKIAKGNIMYERLATGEVVASLIKKPDVQRSSSLKVDSERKKAQPRVTQPPYVRPNQPTISNLDQCPPDYPVNEHNVMDVLEQSIQATQSMRLLLMSLRDDLRRMGGSNNTMATTEQVRKRKEVASHLATAYAAYKESIDNIENVRFASSTTLNNLSKSELKDKRAAENDSRISLVSERSSEVSNASKVVSQGSSTQQSKVSAEGINSTSSSDSVDNGVQHDMKCQLPGKKNTADSVDNLQNSVSDSDGGDQS